MCVCVCELLSQSCPVSPSHQQEATKGDEGVSAPTPHEASAEVRQTSSEGSSGLLVRERGGQVGGVTLAIELDRAQSQGLDCGGSVSHKTERESVCVSE